MQKPTSESDIKLSNEKKFRQAAYDGKLEVIQSLIEKVNINAVGPATGQTALHRAADKNHDHIIKFLISKRVLLEMQDHSGNTPLHLACLNLQFNAVVELIKAGANSLATNKNGKTPLNLIYSAFHSLEPSKQLNLNFQAQVDASMKVLKDDIIQNFMKKIKAQSTGQIVYPTFTPQGDFVEAKNAEEQKRYTSGIDSHQQAWVKQGNTSKLAFEKELGSQFFKRVPNKQTAADVISGQLKAQADLLKSDRIGIETGTASYFTYQEIEFLFSHRQRLLDFVEKNPEEKLVLTAMGNEMQTLLQSIYNKLQKIHPTTNMLKANSQFFEFNKEQVKIILKALEMIEKSFKSKSLSVSTKPKATSEDIVKPNLAGRLKGTLVQGLYTIIDPIAKAIPSDHIVNFSPAKSSQYGWGAFITENENEIVAILTLKSRYTADSIIEALEGNEMFKAKHFPIKTNLGLCLIIKKDDLLSNKDLLIQAVETCTHNLSRFSFSP